MKNEELDKILKSAHVPERAAVYWKEFPGRMMAQIRSRAPSAQITNSGASETFKYRYLRRILTTPGLGGRSGGGTCLTGGSWFWRRGPIGLASGVLCIIAALALFLWRADHRSGADPQLAEAQKCFREIEGLFPNQLEAIIFDRQGPHLVLADHADVPHCTPVYVKVCDSRGCQRFVTFSGQRIEINGASFEVLVNRQGEVLLVGEQSVWTSSERSPKAGTYRIEARPLETIS